MTNSYIIIEIYLEDIKILSHEQKIFSVYSVSQINYDIKHFYI
jgi:hypothetical protein